MKRNLITVFTALLTLALLFSAGCTAAPTAAPTQLAFEDTVLAYIRMH